MSTEPALRFTLTRDVEEFAARAEGFLAARIERNVMATVLINVRGDHPAAGWDSLFAYGCDSRGAAGRGAPDFALADAGNRAR
jgi:hypothetical protein